MNRQRSRASLDSLERRSRQITGSIPHRFSCSWESTPASSSDLAPGSRLPGWTSCGTGLSSRAGWAVSVARKSCTRLRIAANHSDRPATCFSLCSYGRIGEQQRKPCRAQYWRAAYAVLLQIGSQRCLLEIEHIYTTGSKIIASNLGAADSLSEGWRWSITSTSLRDLLLLDACNDAACGGPCAL